VESEWRTNVHLIGWDFSDVELAARFPGIPFAFLGIVKRRGSNRIWLAQALAVGQVATLTDAGPIPDEPAHFPWGIPVLPDH